MPYKEKIAWMTLITIALTFVPYFILAALKPPGDALPNFQQLGTYAAAALANVVALGIGHLLLRWRAPEDAKAPTDERDRAIAQNATTAGYYVLMAGMILVACIMPFLSRGWEIVNAGLFWLVLAEVVRHLVTAYGYRKQAA